jgi:hypothetical protein
MNTSGEISSGYLSTPDWVTPLWSKKLFKPYGDQNADLMLELMAQPNGYEVVGNKTGEWLEEDRFHMFASVNANVASVAANTPQTFIIPASEVDPITGAVYPVKGNMLMHATSRRQYVITDVVGDAVSILPMDGSSASPALLAGHKFIIYSDTRPEASEGPDGQYSGVSSYTWATQIIRTAMQTTGTVLSTELKAVDGQNGGKNGTYGQFYRGMEYRNLLYMTGAFLFGAKQTNPAVEAFSLSTTDGLDVSIAQRGQNIDTAGAEIDETSFYAMTDLFETQVASTNYTLWGAKKRIDEIEVNMKDYLANTNLAATAQQYATYAFGDSTKIKGLEATFAFNQITLGGRNFFPRKLGILSDPRTYNIEGIANNSFQDLAYLLPMGNTAVKDSKGKDLITPFVSVKNHSFGGVDRYMRIWETGAMANSNKTRKDVLEVDCLTDCGYQFAAVNQFGAFR